MKYSKQTIAAGVAVATVLLALYTNGFGIPKLETENPTGSIQPASSIPIVKAPTTTDWKSYSNSEWGVSFQYPTSLFLVQRDLSTGERKRLLISLFPDTPDMRDLVAGKIVGADGPAGISIELFQNDLDLLSAENWVTGTEDSNYKLAYKPYELFTFLSMPAVAYEHDGLYPTRVVAIADSKAVYAFSVNMQSDPDPLYPLFEEILGTVELR